LDYGHGTGHGIGINVHEGPQRITYDFNLAPDDRGLVENMLSSNGINKPLKLLPYSTLALQLPLSLTLHNSYNLQNLVITKRAHLESDLKTLCA